jgi:hypothetical protein
MQKRILGKSGLEVSAIGVPIEDVAGAVHGAPYPEHLQKLVGR